MGVDESPSEKTHRDRGWAQMLTLPSALSKHQARDFPGGAVVKNMPANAGDTGSSPGPGRSHMPRSN